MKNGFQLYHQWLALFVVFLLLGLLLKLLSDRVSKKYRKGIGTFDSGQEELKLGEEERRVEVRFLKVFTMIVPYILSFFIFLLAVVSIVEFRVKAILFLSISSLLVLLLSIFSSKKGDFDWNSKDTHGTS